MLILSNAQIIDTLKMYHWTNVAVYVHVYIYIAIQYTGFKYCYWIDKDFLPIVNLHVQYNQCFLYSMTPCHTQNTHVNHRYKMHIHAKWKHTVYMHIQMINVYSHKISLRLCWRYLANKSTQITLYM